jgi:hypothetical protein
VELIKLAIDGAFIAERLSLSWRELHFGLRNELITSDGCLPFAVAALAKTDAPSRALRDLAGSFGDDLENEHRVEALAMSEPELPDEVLKEKWEYLVMSWYFAHWDSMSDPYETADEVAADFGPAARLRPLLRYSPGPAVGTLVDRWRAYLDERAASLGSKVR